MTIEEDQKALAEYQAETMWVSHQYQELFNHYEAVRQHNKDFEEQCKVIQKDFEEENMRDA